MAVYTHLDDTALAKAAAEYGLGALIRAEGIAEGVENSNYLIEAEGGRAILTLFEKRTREEDLPFFMSLMQHLAGQGVLCPQPLMNADGEALSRIAGRPAAMVSFLDGKSVTSPNADHCRQLGVALATLHEAGLNAPLQRENDLSVVGWLAIYEKIEARLDEIEEGLRALIEAELAHVKDNWPSDLPRGIIHADLFPNNVFFDNDGKLSGVIDFYFACEDTLAYDIAICLNCWCFDEEREFNDAKAEALLEGYVSVRALSDVERAAMPLLTRGAALRFLLTRTHDWLFHEEGALVTPHDPKEYVRKLQYWQEVS